MGIGLEMEWAPFQIDANMGWSAAVQEMLLFSVPGKISVLPALPEKWSKGSVSGLMARGGIAVSIDWNEESVRVELLSATDQTIQFSVDGGDWEQVDLVAGEVFQTVEKNRV
jgi:alpha-L-fucosidase 2